MAVGLDIKGLDELRARLREVAKGNLARAGVALRGVGELVMTVAKERTPVLSGALRGSGYVTGPSDAQVVRLAFGGPAADYAVYVHENLTARHENGQAKFLESAVLEAAPDLAARVAARMRLVE